MMIAKEQMQRTKEACSTLQAHIDGAKGAFDGLQSALQLLRNAMENEKRAECPNCEGTLFELQSTGSAFRICCRTCGCYGPFGNTLAEAQEKFDALVDFIAFLDHSTPEKRRTGA